MIKKVPRLQKLHKYLLRANECGFITRQELVSMLPPLFLDIKSTDLVLDVCAAPGSKTSQIVEFITGMGKEQSRIPEGGVMANEIDFQRAYILAHQLKRLNSPSMAVINHDAQFLPSIYDESINSYDNKVYFDKILVDVPCSGDGALRKLPGRWRYWSVHDAIHLHKTQVKILMRAIKLAKVGGLIVYSTCSLNAIENEAVVAEIISRANSNQEGSLELVDITKRLDGFKMREGLNQWKFILPKRNNVTPNNGKSPGTTGSKQDDHNNGMFESFNTYEEFLSTYSAHPKLSKNVSKSMFSNDPYYLTHHVHLDRTARILPHDNNSGGFYFALIKKNGYVHFWEDKAEANVPKPNTIENPERAVKFEDIKEKRPKSTYRLAKTKDLAVIKTVAPDIIEELRDQYGLNDSFPFDQLITIAEQGKRLQLISKRIKGFIDANTKNLINFVNVGTSVFVRNKSGGDFWRLSQDGIRLVRPYMSKNIIQISKEFFLYLIGHPQSLPFSGFSDNFAKEKQEMEKLDIGCYCFCYRDSEEELLCVVKMKQSLVMFVSKEDIEGLKMKYTDE